MGILMKILVYNQADELTHVLTLLQEQPEG